MLRRLWARLGQSKATEGAEFSHPEDETVSAEARLESSSGAASFEMGEDPSVREIQDVDRNTPESGERALRALQRLAGTPLERRALAACLTAHGQNRAPAGLSCLAAELFVRRGETDHALHLLSGLDEPRAWLLEADLRAEGGQLGVALDLIDKVLARDILLPGALERARRWRPAPPVQNPGADQPTLLGNPSLATSLTIVGEAGRGGAATVYQARDSVLGRAVALKVYHRPRDAREQLLRESRLAVQLASGNIVRVFDASTEHGWIAMEWAALGSLKRRLASEFASVADDSAGWFRDLVRALAGIHDAGYVHGDVKPANVLFRADRSVILSDFGLAVQAGKAHLGISPGYASPERLAGSRASARDDVFALGRVLAEIWDPARESAPAAQSWKSFSAWLVSDTRPGHAGEVLARLPGPSL